MFEDFPDETLFQICSYLGPQRSERVLGHTEEPPPTLPGSYLILDFVANSSDIFNLALTSWRFRKIVQKYLFRAPVVWASTYWFSHNQNKYRVAYFLRALLGCPGLGKQVKELRLRVPFYEIVVSGCDNRAVTSNQDGIEEFYEIFRTASEDIASSEVPEGFWALWQKQINFDRHHTLTRLLLALLPHLENVSVSDETHHGV
jgi:hypothetical protein